MKTSSRVVAAIILWLINIPSFSTERATADDAVALVKLAVAYVKKNGREKALAAFNDQNTKQFHERGLYIFAIDKNGTSLANGALPKLVGKNLIDLKDADGKYVMKAMLETAQRDGKGWVDYRWPNPSSNGIESKSSYLEMVDNIVIGAGIYK